MSDQRRPILMAYLLGIIAISLYPPFLQRSTEGTVNLGYQFIWSGGSEIDIPRFLLGYIALSAVVGIAILFKTESRAKPTTSDDNIIDVISRALALGYEVIDKLPISTFRNFQEVHRRARVAGHKTKNDILRWAADEGMSEEAKQLFQVLIEGNCFSES